MSDAASRLTLPPDVAAQAAARKAAEAPATRAVAEAQARAAAARAPQRTLAGTLVVGNGCYVNPANVRKYDVATTGRSFGVFAHLVGDEAPVLLSPLLGTKEAAYEWLDKLCTGAFLTFRIEDGLDTDKFHGVDWDIYEQSGIPNSL